MKDRELKIEVPDGYEIDKEKSTFEKIIFKKVEKELPKSWEELKIISGYYLDSWGDICECEVKLDTISDNRNIFPTKEEAEVCLALSQLCQLRDRYNDGWKPCWNTNTIKHCIYVSKGEIRGGHQFENSRILTFEKREIRDKFLENFKDLIEIAKPLL